MYQESLLLSSASFPQFRPSWYCPAPFCRRVSLQVLLMVPVALVLFPLHVFSGGAHFLTPRLFGFTFRVTLTWLLGLILTLWAKLFHPKTGKNWGNSGETGGKGTGGSKTVGENSGLNGGPWKGVLFKGLLGFPFGPAKRATTGGWGA